MPIPAAFMKKGKAAEGSEAEESPDMEKAEGKKPCAACKKKGKKKGSCGCDSKPKMDRALSPQEYLDACDLGIQDRSKSYIRTRLDARKTAGKGVKCGGGYISQGEKCGGAKGTVGSVKRKKAKKPENEGFAEYQRRQQAANRASLAGSFMGGGPASGRIARALVTDGASREDVMATVGKGQGTKCGNSYIGKGKKCKSSGGALASTSPMSTKRKVVAGAGKALGVIGGAGQLASTGLAISNLMKGNYTKANKWNAASGGFGALQGAGNVAEGAATGNKMLRNKGNARIGVGAVAAGLGLYGAGVKGKDIKNAAKGGKAAVGDKMSMLKAKLAKRVNKVAGEAAVKKSNVTLKTKKSQFERLYKKP